MSTYYDVFGCSPDAPIEEIKIKYRQLLLMLHPDKASHHQFKCMFTYDQVHEAWNTLRDASSRHIYDETLKAQRIINDSFKFGWNTIVLSEMEYNSTDDNYSVACRCGDSYSFEKEGYEDVDILEVPCDTCSLTITVDMRK